MTRFSVSVFENEIGTGHRFLINKPQRPLRFINLIRQNTVAQHHPESVSSAKNKRRQILLRKTKQPGITLNQRNHLRYRNIFLFFRFFPVIQQSADALLLFVKNRRQYRINRYFFCKINFYRCHISKF